MPAMILHRLLVALSAAMLWTSSPAPALVDRPKALTKSDPLLVVTGIGFPANDISLATLKIAFRGKIAHVNGKTIIPINHAVGTAMRADFDRLILGLEPSAVGRYWVDRRIRDEGVPPKSIPTPELAVRVVAAVPAAITYARQGLLNNKVKALTIDGKGANEPGYALAAAQ
jgi:hypothetical protein